MRRTLRPWSLPLVLAVIAAGCGGGTRPADERTVPAADGRTVALNKEAYPVFVDPDAGADPSVPAEQGGRGFTGEGWETNTDFDLIGDPRAVKGGVLRQAMMTDFPSTLRYYGPNVSAWNLMLNGLVYESLLFLHPTTLEYIPGLATHWQIADDRRTFRFRLDPNARWSDGMPVVAEDVVASWKLSVDRSLQDPARNLIYGNFQEPVAESPYIVSVRAKNDNWQNFMHFCCGARLGGLFIYPAHVIGGLTGDEYIREYNYRMVPGSGPYIVEDEDVERGRRIRIRRRPDYWAAQHRRNIGLGNFDEIQQLVVRDRNLEFEMFKRGDIDYFWVQTAQMWVQELDYEHIQRGLNLKRKIFNHQPQGIQGVAMNTRRAPYDDIRVRKALRHLFNRELMIRTLMFGEYEMMDSLFPGSLYENPENEPLRYDPEAAVALLADAGWTQRNAGGQLTKDGRPLVLDLAYASQSAERYFTMFQEDLRKIGITLNLRFTTFETLVKLLDDRAFDMVFMAYTGELFPTPEANWLSELAGQKNNNNVTGFRNGRADALMREYQKEFDLDRRVALLRELDGILTSEHHWLLQWFGPYERIVFWNRFGAPPGYLTRTGDYRDMALLWWIDPTKSQQLDAALRDPSIRLDQGQTDNRYWLDYADRDAGRTPATR